MKSPSDEPTLVESGYRATAFRYANLQPGNPKNIEYTAYETSIHLFHFE
jgi:hypothetical protein